MTDETNVKNFATAKAAAEAATTETEDKKAEAIEQLRKNMSEIAEQMESELGIEISPFEAWMCVQLFNLSEASFRSNQILTAMMQQAMAMQQQPQGSGIQLATQMPKEPIQ